MKKLSVIIPVYNVEKYLVECLSSVEAQNLNDDYEVLLIDDGSTDNSGRICENFVKDKPNYRLIQQANSGLSVARNIGIEVASGTYLCFIDSDDFIFPNSLPAMIAKMERDQLDILSANTIRLMNGKQCKDFQEADSGKVVETGEKYISKLIKKKTMQMQVPYALYRREFIVENNLYFEKGLLHEDELWTPQVYLAAKRVAHIDLDYYCYRERLGSITNSPQNAKKSKDVISICKKLVTVYQTYPFPDGERRLFLDYLCGLYLRASFDLMDMKFTCDKAGIDRLFPLRFAGRGKNRCKAVLFFCSPSLYYMIHKIFKP